MGSRTQPTVRVERLGGTWEVIGRDRLRGVVVEDLNMNYSDWGPDSASFRVKAVGSNIARPELLPFTPVEVEQEGRVIWSGRIMAKPVDADSHSVQCEGWHHATQDNPYRKLYVHQRLSDYTDLRSLPDINLIEVESAGRVRNENGHIVIGWDNGHAFPSANRQVGVIFDAGHGNAIKRVTCVYESSDNTFRASFFARVTNTRSLSVGIEDAFIVAMDQGASRTDSGTLTNPGRYLTLFINNGSAHTIAVDQYIRIKECIVVSDTAYETGDASALTASDVVTDATGRLGKEFNASTALITATSFVIEEWQSEWQTPRENMEAANAIEDNQIRVAGDDQRTIEYRPRPTAPEIEVGGGYGFQDSSESGQLIYNRVIVTGKGADGFPVQVTRTTGDLVGVPVEAVDQQLANASFDTDLSDWTVTFGSAARITSPVDSSPGAMRLDTGATPLVRAVNTSWTSNLVLGVTYELSFALRDVGSVVMDAINLWVGTDLLEVDPADLSTSAFTVFTVPFVAATAQPEVGVFVAGQSQGQALIVDTFVNRTAIGSQLDKRGLTRARVLPISSSITDAVAEKLGEIWLAQHNTTPFSGSLTVVGDRVRRIRDGVLVDPAHLGQYVGGLIRLSDRIDPDNGGLGRDGRIVGLTYAPETRTATIAIDDRRNVFETIITRYAALAGG